LLNGERKIYFSEVLKMKNAATLLVVLALLALTGCTGLWNKPPVAKITAINTDGYAPLKVLFSATGSYDPDGRITSYSWDFGDGFTGYGEDVTHTYYYAGTYYAYVCVEDDDGAESCSGSVTITVYKNFPPHADYTAYWYDYWTLTVKFDATSSYDSDGWIELYCWTISGSTDCFKTPYAYYSFYPGTYSVKLEVYDNHGASDDITKTWYVYYSEDGKPVIEERNSN
jgi:PKD repeat protein